MKSSMLWLLLDGMKGALILLTIALAAAVFVHVKLGLPLGGALMIFFVGWPLIGTLVTADDGLPGGWSNPDGTETPLWETSPFWGQIVAGLSLSAAGFAIDSGWNTHLGLVCWLLAVAAAFLSSALVTRKWWLALGSLTALGALWL